MEFQYIEHELKFMAIKWWLLRSHGKKVKTEKKKKTVKSLIQDGGSM